MANHPRCICAGTVLAIVPFLTVSLDAQVEVGVYKNIITFNGDLPEHFMGSAVAGVGDVNGDTADDVLVGARGEDPVLVDAGSAFLYSGKDGLLINRFNGLTDYDALGTSVAGAGDVNGDSVPDVILGAPGTDRPDSGVERGAAYVHSGKDSSLLWQIDGTEDFGRMGWAVAGPGDMNGDGFDDVVVTAYRADANGVAGAGSVHALSGKDGTPLWQVDGTVIDGNLGYSAAGAGDVNQDGVPDVIVGSIGLSAVYVYSGKDGSEIWHRVGPGGGYGGSVDGIGDVNGDTVVDVIVGASSAGVSGEGMAFVYSGTGAELFTIGGASPSDELGASVAGAGDVDKDGFGDFMIGATGTSAGGSVYVYSGRDQSVFWRFDGETTADNLGSSVARAGDLDGDSFEDVILGADAAVVGGADVGSAYVHLMKPSVVTIGSGIPGLGGIVPCLHTGGLAARVGSIGFKVEMIDTAGGVPAVIAGSLGKANTQLLGLTLYGDFLTPGLSAAWAFTTTGMIGSPGVGVATLPIPIPSDPTLVGLRTYWQGFTLDSASPLPVGVVHTGGLEVTIQ